MKFRRINDSTIRCIVSREDLQEYGLALEDFFKNKGKVHEFLHEVVERAEEAVGYEPKDGMLSMQIMPIGPNAVSITFSDGEADKGEVLLQNIKDTIRTLMESEEERKLLEETGLLLDEDEDYDDSDYESLDESEEGYQTKQLEQSFPVGDSMVVSLDSLEALSKFCKAAGVDKTVKSDLYYLPKRKQYCLLAEKGRLSMTVFRYLVLLAVEFGADVSDSEIYMSYIREHGELMIEKKAYRILRKNY